MAATHSKLDVKTKDGVKFGKELRDKEFLFDDAFVNLNHGSFGTYPKIVRDKLRSLQDAAESRPDHFIRYTYPRLLDESREAMAKFLNAPSETVVFVPNATTGVNTVLRNLTFESGDYILYFATIYGACEKTVAYLIETTPVKSVKIQYTFPVEDDWFIHEFERVVRGVEDKGGKVKVAIFDTVVSMPGVRMPFERLVKKSKELGVLSLIDAAHGVGHVELNMTELDPDFFVSNCHKWLHVPRGCAIFYVPVRNQKYIKSTLPTSHGFIPQAPNIPSPLPKSAFLDSKRTPFVANFEFVGTIDNAPYLCLLTAITWRENLGGEAVIRQYCWDLARTAAQYTAEQLGTEILDNDTKTLTRCCMANVALPISYEDACVVAAKAGIKEEDVGGTVRDWMSKTMVEEYNTFIQSVFYGGKWWARLSGQVYLDMKDFEFGAKILKKLCDRVKEGEWAKVQSQL